MEPWLIEQLKKEEREDKRERLHLPIELWEDILEQDKEEKEERGVCVIYEGQEDEDQELASSECTLQESGSYERQAHGS